jgi:hypothetical protein
MGCRVEVGHIGFLPSLGRIPVSRRRGCGNRYVAIGTYGLVPRIHIFTRAALQGLRKDVNGRNMLAMTKSKKQETS